MYAHAHIRVTCHQKCGSLNLPRVITCQLVKQAQPAQTQTLTQQKANPAQDKVLYITDEDCQKA